MFAKSENTGKKKFQKPNILRRKSKGPLKSSVLEHGISSVKSVLPASVVSAESELAYVNDGRLLPKPEQKVTLDNMSYEDGTISYSSQPHTTNDLVSGSGLLNNNNEDPQSSVNFELFLNDCHSIQNFAQFHIDSETFCNTKDDWCLDFTKGSHEIIIENFNDIEVGNKLQPISSTTLASLPALTVEDREPSMFEAASTETPPHNLTIEYLASSTMTFKCDAPNCTKRFRSEMKLNKHKATHSTEGCTKLVRQTAVDCPVKKVGTDGAPVPCGRTFLARQDLVKHLNEDHIIEDASYLCTECGRRFFSAMGLRAHLRSHRARGAGGAGGAALACAWPGCGRVFRQPCRLREHARKHTGDRPYPCRHPNCNWSFRTASKLLRHARRHTGERRHACAACGRAFLRREHLREHLVRHAAAERRRCTGCDRTFSTLGALLRHARTAHGAEPRAGSPPPAPADRPAPSPGEPLTGSLESPELDAPTPASVETPVLGTDADIAAQTDADAVADVFLEVECRAARTHCTWPLQPDAAPAYETCANEYALEDDAQVELSEGSESNTYTIRSDLFLHGNILNNEDSEHMPGAGAVVAEAGAGHAVDTDLGLLDAHPTSDLMQDELLYTDAAVDESSFRVFLLSGEEIQIV